MVLIERTTVLTATLPVQVLKDHLRLGSGFTDDSLQDGVLETVLRAALAAVEARTGKVVLEHGFTWTMSAWRDRDSQALPVAPVQSIGALRLVDRASAAVVIDPALYVLQKDDQRPRLVPTGACLPVIPAMGVAEVEFEAGFSPTWGGLPADLAQAVTLLAAHFYDNRSTGDETVALPTAVTGLLERYRTVRIIGGDAS